MNNNYVGFVLFTHKGYDMHVEFVEFLIEPSLKET